MEQYGGPDAIKVVELDDPKPAKGQVAVAVEYAAVNFPDLLIMQNLYQVSVPLPYVPGSEYSGRVVELGEGVTNYAIGDRVYGGAIAGAFSERVLGDAGRLNRVPDGVSMKAAAAFNVVYGTSYHTLRSTAEVKPGEWVVVLGASGGVGLSSVEIARVMGAKVLAAASTDEKCAICLERGADAVVNYETEDLKERIKQITGGGADVVVDPVGGRYSEQALRATKFGSRFVVIGFAAGDIPKIALNLVLLKGVRVMGFEMRTFGENAAELQKRDQRELLALLAEGKLDPYVSAIYPLERAAEAMRAVEARAITGKVLIEMTGAVNEG